MEAGVLRVLVLTILFFLLTADYSALFTQVFGTLRPDASATPQDAVATATDDDATYADAAARRNTKMKTQLMSAIRSSCLPKLICELNAAQKNELSEAEKALLDLIRDTSISVTAEVTSKYHFAAHMGQLVAGVEGQGCHNFYPSCPLPTQQVLRMVSKVRVR